MTTRRRDWPILTGLILLSVVPAFGGALRVVSLSGGEVTPENVRFFAAPVPVLLHIVAAVAFTVLGAFQFAPGFRNRHRAWHRRVGRLLVLCGLTVAATALWMNASYVLPPSDGALLMVLRYLFAATMFVAVGAGFLAVRRRRIGDHRAWMMRGYAIAQGAGTQAVLLSAWLLAVGPTSQLSRAVLMGTAWTVNLAVAEWLIRRRRPARVVPARATILVEA
ncbi:DUF2306 domain-containing protein [Micromonospora zhanjiangensis]|uniref:DUF2306 domain-containing protein n=1 Tax=Micromonospora zhanjiangensis TaxID=1522057 RepID=A0ABV8KQA5_9ACTN